MPKGTTEAVFMHGIFPAELTGNVAKSLAGTNSSDALQAHVSVNKLRKAPNRNAFFNIFGHHLIIKLARRSLVSKV